MVQQGARFWLTRELGAICEHVTTLVERIAAIMLPAIGLRPNFQENFRRISTRFQDFGGTLRFHVALARGVTSKARTPADGQVTVANPAHLVRGERGWLMLSKTDCPQ
jgi:hypothetical protein